jgi:hypothetical protein
LIRVRKNSFEHYNQPYHRDEIGMNKKSSSNNRFGNLYYLGNTSECCFAVCGLKKGDRATVGHFVTTQDLPIVKLVDGMLFDYNKNHLGILMLYLVDKVLSMNTDNADKDILYNMCQWVFNIVSANGAVGVQYDSSRWKRGNWKCYAFVNDEHIEWEQSDLVDILEVDKINHSYKIRELDYPFG